MGESKPLIAPAPAEAVFSYHGITTADGNLMWTTLVCDGLGARADLSNQLVLIKSGACDGQSRDITGHAGNTLTVDPAFETQIVSGVEFYVLPTVSESSEVATLLSRLTDYRAGILDNLTLGTVYQTANFPTGVAEQDILELTPVVRFDYSTLFIDVHELTQVTTVRQYLKVDGVNYRLVDVKTYPNDFPAGVEVIAVGLGILSEDMKITFQSDVAEGVDRQIYYIYGTWGAV